MKPKNKLVSKSKARKKPTRSQSKKTPERPKIDISSEPSELDVRKAVEQLRKYADLLDRTGAGEYVKGRIGEVRDPVCSLWPCLVATWGVGETMCRKKTNLKDVEFNTKNLTTDCLADLDNIGKVPVQESIKALRGEADELEKIWGLTTENQVTEIKPKADKPQEVKTNIEGESWQAKTIGLLWEHRELSIEAIAKKVGKTRQALYNDKDINIAIKARHKQKHAQSSLPSGEKDSETGRIEAW